MHTYDIDKNEIHELNVRISPFDTLPFFREKGITEFVEKCRSLVSLELLLSECGFGPINDWPPALHSAFQEDAVQFARAIGASNVRNLNLDNFNTAATCIILDNLPTSRIHSLHLSLSGPDMGSEEEAVAVDSLVRFLADPARSRRVIELNVYRLTRVAAFFLWHIIIGSYATVGGDSRAFVHVQKPNLSFGSVYFDWESSNPIHSRHGCNILGTRWKPAF